MSPYVVFLTKESTNFLIELINIYRPLSYTLNVTNLLQFYDLSTFRDLCFKPS